MPALPVDAELLNRKSTKKKAAVEAPAKKAKPAPSTEQAPPKPFGKRVAEQKAAVKPSAKLKASEKYESPADLGIAAGPSQDDRTPSLSGLVRRPVLQEFRGNHLHIKIAAGFKDGVFPGATGKIGQGTGESYFEVVEVINDRLCLAKVSRDDGRSGRMDDIKDQMARFD
jgi:hypothetical protein